MTRKGLSWWEPVAIVGVIGLLASLVAPTPGATGRSWMTAWYFAKQDVRDCKRNLQNLATASEMYSTDYGGRYERSLSCLTPLYLKRLPTCPSAEADTYSAGYTSASSPDAYTIVCSGWNHRAARLPPNRPEFDSAPG